MVSLLASFAFASLLIVAAIKDVTSYTIPNWISIALAGGFVVLGPFAFALPVFGIHLAVGAGAFAVAAGMFAMGWIGGGDAKLFAAAALWFGWADLGTYLFAFCVVGGLFTLVLMAARSAPFVPAFALRAGWVRALLEPKGPVPYGVALAVGGLMIFPSSEAFAAFAAV